MERHWSLWRCMHILTIEKVTEQLMTFFDLKYKMCISNEHATALRMLDGLHRPAQVTVIGIWKMADHEPSNTQRAAVVDLSRKRRRATSCQNSGRSTSSTCWRTMASPSQRVLAAQGGTPSNGTCCVGRPFWPDRMWIGWSSKCVPMAWALLMSRMPTTST